MIESVCCGLLFEAYLESRCLINTVTCEFMYWARDRHIAETNWSELQRLIALFFYIRTIIVFGSCTLIYDDKLFYLFDDVKIILLISVAEPHNCMRFNAIYSKAQHMKKKLGKNSKLFFTFFFFRLVNVYSNETNCRCVFR